MYATKMRMIRLPSHWSTLLRVAVPPNPGQYRQEVQRRHLLRRRRRTTLLHCHPRQCPLRLLERLASRWALS